MGNVRMTRGLNKKETTVNTGILDVSFSLRCQLLSQVCRMLVLDIFDNGIPAIAN